MYIKLRNYEYFVQTRKTRSSSVQQTTPLQAVTCNFLEPNGPNRLSWYHSKIENFEGNIVQILLNKTTECNMRANEKYEKK